MDMLMQERVYVAFLLGIVVALSLCTLLDLMEL